MAEKSFKDKMAETSANIQAKVEARKAEIQAKMQTGRAAAPASPSAPAEPSVPAGAAEVAAKSAAGPAAPPADAPVLARQTSAPAEGSTFFYLMIAVHNLHAGVAEKVESSVREKMRPPSPPATPTRSPPSSSCTTARAQCQWHFPLRSRDLCASPSPPPDAMRGLDVSMRAVLLLLRPVRSGAQQLTSRCGSPTGSLIQSPSTHNRLSKTR